MKILQYIVGGIAVLAVFTGFMLAANFIPWALWNFGIAPTFSWPEAGFWQVFFICWGLGIIGRLLFNK